MAFGGAGQNNLKTNVKTNTTPETSLLSRKCAKLSKTGHQESIWMTLLLTSALAVTSCTPEQKLGPVLSTKADYLGRRYDFIAVGLDGKDSSVGPHAVLSTGLSSWGMYLKDSVVYFCGQPLRQNSDNLPAVHYPLTSTLSIFEGNELKPIATRLSGKEAVAALLNGKLLD